jgi:EAL domain-containing protein (putative c-di-GMP-specific phosphodiesterase class I)
LNLRVIAEGVETEEQLAFWPETNCDEMQGYHFSKPVPPQSIEKFLKERLNGI